MAEPVTAASASHIDLLDNLRSIGNEGPKKVSILMAGKGGSGKTSLANALLTNNSSGGGFGPEKGTATLANSQTRSYPNLNVEVTVTDAIGFASLYVSDDEILAHVHEQCDVDSLTAVVVCLRWDDKFDEISRKILSLVGSLHENIWEKVTFALTHCDRLPPEFEEKTKAEKESYLSTTLQLWKGRLKFELCKLGVSEAIIEDLLVSPTSHTAVRIEKDRCGALFPEGMSNWLENLWNNLVEIATKFQPENFLNILSLLLVHLFHRVGSTAGEMVTVSVKEVEKFFTRSRIGAIFLGGTIGGAVVGAGGGALAGVALADVVAVVIGSTVVSGACVAVAATGGIFAGVAVGVAAIATLVAVVLYGIHKYQQRKRNT